MLAYLFLVRGILFAGWLPSARVNRPAPTEALAELVATERSQPAAGLRVLRQRSDPNCTRPSGTMTPQVAHLAQPSDAGRDALRGQSVVGQPEAGED